MQGDKVKNSSQWVILGLKVHMCKMKASGCDQISVGVSLSPGGIVILTGIGAVIQTTGQGVSAGDHSIGTCPTVGYIFLVSFSRE